MAVVLNNGKIVSNEREAAEFLESVGISSQDFESFFTLLNYNVVHDLKFERDCLANELDSYEASCDRYHSALNEIQNICDEKLAMQRISKSRETFESISKLINEYI